MHSILRRITIRAAGAGLLLMAVCCSAGVIAQETVVQFDPAQTQVGFTLADTLHTVRGQFKLKQGEIRFDPATGAASGAIVIDARSGASGNGARDGRMNRSILESNKYPEITFHPQRVKGRLAPEGESQIEVDGTFNIHGADHPLTLLAKVNASNSALKIDTHFVVPYVKWGMKNPSLLFLRVPDTVDIDVHAQGRVQ